MGFIGFQRRSIGGGGGGGGGIMALSHSGAAITRNNLDGTWDVYAPDGGVIDPNSFEGTDKQKIQQAVDLAHENGKTVVIGFNMASASLRWNITDAIRLDSNVSIRIDGAVLKLTDSCRDNVFRTANCGNGLTNPSANPVSNISIVGINGTIQGADNPRSTGDIGKTLNSTGVGLNNSYGTDAGVAGQLQTGDWRNIGLLFGYASNISISGLRVVNMHAWAFSFERCTNVNISNIKFNCPKLRGPFQVKNCDGIDFRLGCKNITVTNITGHTEDDTVACTIIPAAGDTPGQYGIMEVTGRTYTADVDDITGVTIQNVSTSGTENMLRFLNGAGTKMKHVNVSNIVDANVADVRVTIINIGSNGYAGGAAALGDTSNFNISSVYTDNSQYGIAFFTGSLRYGNFSNIVKKNYGTIIYGAGGPGNVRDVYLNGIPVSDTDTLVAGMVGNPLASWGTTEVLSGLFVNSQSYAELRKLSSRVSTETALDNYADAGFFVTPNSGLVGLPTGWAQKRYGLLCIGAASNLANRTQYLVDSTTGQIAFRSTAGGTFTTWTVLSQPINNATTAALTAANLNASYGSHPVGQLVMCPSIAGAPTIYMKSTENGSSDQWLSVPATIVT